MIKNICASVAVMIYASMATGQVQFGVKAGINLTSTYWSGSDNPGYKTSFNAGALALVPLFPGFQLQPEIMYSGQGSEQSFTTGSVIIELGYLNVPVLFKYQHETGLFAETGPQLGILLTANKEVDGMNSNIKSNFQSSDFSWAFGIGYKFSEIGLGIDARYNLGLSNISYGGSEKNTVFQLGLFYMFDFDR
jgi:hypothetical protein